MQNTSYNEEVGIFLSVLQSDWNSFCGDVVLDSSNMAYRDGDINSYQIYEQQIYSALYNNELIKIGMSAIGLLFSSLNVILTLSKTRSHYLNYYAGPRD